IACRIVRNRAGSRLPKLRASWFAETAVIGIAAVERVDVLHLRPNHLKLVTCLERMPFHDPGIVHLRVPDDRILELWIGSLTAQGGESVDRLVGEPAGELRILREACDPVQSEHAGAA